MSVRPAALVLGLLAAPGALAGDVALHGLVAGRALAVDGREAWMAGGFGRLGEGGTAGRFEAAARAEAQVAVDWSPTPTTRVRAHAVARAEPGAAGGWRAGLTEAFVQVRPEITPSLALGARGGLFFLPTSRENVDPLWQSPYTLTLSAVNTWIGEEVRLAGLEGAVEIGAPGRSRVDVAAAPFWGADTAGALVAWRGWSMGTRLSVVGETLPLPPLPTLAPGGPFAEQRDDGTRPVDELDGSPGWHARARWSRPGLFLLQAAWTDTRGDRALHRGQYAWATRFASVGAEAQVGRLRLVAEGVFGETGMGEGDVARVDAGFRAAYALLTWSDAGDRFRLSARYDRFRNDDRDGRPEPNDESGWALTVAAFCAPRPWLRLGLELFELRSDRPAAAFAGTPASTDARRAQAELRLRF